MTQLGRRLLAEFIGTALLLATVVGSGIMGETLSHGNSGVALLANAAATAGVLYVLISIFGPISGAHFNPAVTATLRLRGELGRAEAAAFICVQAIAAIVGVMLAHSIFGLPLLQPGTHARTGWPQWISEAVATFGLLLTITLGARYRPPAVPALVASYIFAAYWFTASTSFANPAVTLARALTQTFTGIRPGDVAGFVGAQAVGVVVAAVTAKALLDDKQRAVKAHS